MEKELNVYRDWLGITETARPLDYYQLLTLDRFEDDTEKIRKTYRKLNAHVRKYASGTYGKRSQELLNELAKAMLCLTDSVRKGEYDVTLGRKDTREGRRRTFEQILLANKILDRDQLEKARNFAKAVGLEVRDAVSQQKLAPPDVVMVTYAESQGLPYIELADIGLDEELMAQVPPTITRQHSCVPVMVDGGNLLMASPNPLIPDVEQELRLRLGMPVRTVLCTPADINAAITKYYSQEAVPAPAGPAPARKPAVKQDAAKVESKPLTADEQLKRRTMISVVTFNIVVVLYMMYKVFTTTAISFGSAAAMAIVLGLIAAGIAFGVTTFLKI